MSKKSDIKPDMSKDKKNFFMPIPDDVFNEMQTAIENYDKHAESSQANEEGTLKTEMLIELSKKQLASEK